MGDGVEPRRCQTGGPRRWPSGTAGCDRLTDVAWQREAVFVTALPEAQHRSRRLLVQLAIGSAPGQKATGPPLERRRAAPHLTRQAPRWSRAGRPCSSSTLQHGPGSLGADPTAVGHGVATARLRQSLPAQLRRAKPAVPNHPLRKRAKCLNSQATETPSSHILSTSPCSPRLERKVPMAQQSQLPAPLRHVLPYLLLLLHRWKGRIGSGGLDYADPISLIAAHHKGDLPMVEGAVTPWPPSGPSPRTHGSKSGRMGSA